MWARTLATFRKTVGADAVARLAGLPPSGAAAAAEARAAGRYVITVGGDQLTGKSSLARDLCAHPRIANRDGLLTTRSSRFSASRLSSSSAAAAPTTAVRSTGQTMRDLAAERGVTVAELSRVLSEDASGGGGGGDNNNNDDDDDDDIGAMAIDVALDYKTCEILLTVEGDEDVSGGGGGGGGTAAVPSLPPAPPHLLVLEGRQPAVMATFCRDNVPTLPVMPFRVFLTCSAREQALRYVGREISAQAHDALVPLLPADVDFASLEDVLRHLAAHPSGGDLPERDRIFASFADNMRRDDDDRARFDALYGAQCHYRNTDAFYDLVVDTSETTPAEKAELVVDGFARWLDRQR